MLVPIIIILCLIIVFLIYKLQKKNNIDSSEIKKIQDEIHQNELRLNSIKVTANQIEKEAEKDLKIVEQYNNKILEVQNKYREELNKKVSDLDAYFENQKNLRQSEMDIEFERQKQERQTNLDLRMRQMTAQAQEQVNRAEAEAKNEIERWKKAEQDIANDIILQEEKYESLLAPLRQYEMEQQERLFYTIQVPDEYKDDINFLIITVSQKVQHPDIINKLVWAEYVRPYIEQTFKRVGIKDEPGIYKITNIESGKCYIGKSTNLKKRITDHFKSSIGIRTIADQAVHHEIWKTGFWNWTIEPIIYCDKDKLNELEKYYIDFFKSNVFGYNKTGGGEG